MTDGDGEQHLRSALGKAIRLRRVELDLSRADLAREADVSYTYVSEIENGTKQASSKTLWRVARALGLEPHELMATAAQWETRPPAAETAPPVARLAARPAAAESSPPPRPRWFHAAGTAAGGRADSADQGGDDPSTPAPPELAQVLERIAAALDGVPDERAELALLLSLDERRTRRIVREELDRRHGD